MNNCIDFAMWVAQNHYRLHNVDNGVGIWSNEEGVKTTQELYFNFISYKDDNNS